jgi:hypothetical protein
MISIVLISCLNHITFPFLVEICLVQKSLCCPISQSFPILPAPAIRMGGSDSHMEAVPTWIPGGHSAGHSWENFQISELYLGMDQYLLIPFLGG